MQIEIEDAPGEVTATVRTRAAEQRIRFGGDALCADHAGDALLVAALLPAMRHAEPIELAAPVSARLVRALATVQDIFVLWGPGMRRVPVRPRTTVERRVGTEPPGGRVGTFFSGGVDSFFSLLEHQDEITDLVFVHGFDIRLDDRALRERTSCALQAVAAHFGVRLVEVETDLRTLLDPSAAWGDFAHGAALAAVGHLLGPSFRRLYIPSSHSYADLYPFGSHPLLDPLWSSESLEFVHDGAGFRRAEKVARVARSDVALQHLRVCWLNPGGAYNCGRCEKCVRTMISLHAVGALERCPTFDVPLTAAAIRALDAPGENERDYIRQNLAALDGNGANVELRAALQALLDGERPRPTGLARRVVRRLRRELRRLRGPMLTHFPLDS